MIETTNFHSLIIKRILFMIKAVIFDLDETLTTRDMLDWACELVEMAEENEQIKKHPSAGLGALINRINLLSGLKVDQLNSELTKTNYLRTGTESLLEFIKEQGLRTIVCSGNILPILQYYQKKLELDFVLGSPVRLLDGSIEGLTLGDYAFPDEYKFKSVDHLLSQIVIDWSDTVAIGDSPYDICWFEKSKISIAIGSNLEIQAAANYQVENNLAEVIPILQNYL